MLPALDVDQKQSVTLRVEVAVPVEAVPPVVEDTRGLTQALGFTRLPCGLRPGLVLIAEGHGEVAAVGRPLKVPNRSLGKLRHDTRFAPARGNQPDLRLFLVPGTDKRDRTAIRREARLAVAAAVREGGRSRSTVGVHHPQVGDVLVLVADMPAAEHDLAAIRRDVRSSHIAQLEEVLGDDSSSLARLWAPRGTGSRFQSGFRLRASGSRRLHRLWALASGFRLQAAPCDT